MTNEQADMKEIEKQEQKDYEIVNGILQEIFKEKLAGIEKLVAHSGVDCAFTGMTSTQYREYGMEIKTTTQDIYISHGFLLKVAKYLNMLKWKKEHPNHHIYIIYLCYVTRKYYIFDIDVIRLSIGNLRNMRIKVTEYKDTPEIDTPCIILWPNDAVMVGTF